MKNELLPDDRVVRYLLGELSPEEMSDLEGQYFQDDGQFEVIQAVEEELLRDFVKGDLAPDLRQRVEARYRRSPDLAEKLEFAKALVAACAVVRSEKRSELAAEKVSSRTPNASRWNFFRFRFPSLRFAFVTAVVACALVTFGIFKQNENNGLKSSVAQLQQKLAQTQSSFAVLAEKAKRPPLVATFLLAPGRTRSEGAIEPFVVPEGIGQVEFKVPLPPGINYSRFQAVFKRLPNGEISSQDLSPAALVESGQALIVSIPSVSLRPGRYVLFVNGRTSRGGYEVVQYYPFTVEK